uniref:NADH dehydrogenase subunit 5 n=1 Tax=Paranoplocephala sp. RKZ13 TaxID=2854041 RepID=UPI001F12F1E9|nr:NADH dehydrogenase subunit 5 [Paranoplocephala sp. RKZ13]UKS07985.1 NADH dehydrogenase subunit 5 [Paranoplocephala sp. RKZ13]
MIFLLLFLAFFTVVCFSNILLDWFEAILSIEFLPLGGGIWGLNAVLDEISLGILLMLAICFSYVYFYTGHYFGYSKEGKELNKMICLFVSVMALLVCTGDFLLSLVFWEYLGVVSFFLILFYSSYLSLRSSIITLVSSRFGDVCLFLLLCIGCYTLNDLILVLFMVFFLIVFSKSASFPFTSWLLEAMRAPTPVSSLVHSSTLVAAGVWFLMRYDFLLLFEDCFIFSIILLTTIAITGVSCFFFLDLKKIVALSTCNNIAWCIFYLIFGGVSLSLFQLVSHGVSKCMLFILVGDVMSGSSGSQASNCVYSTYLYGNWNVFGLFSIILGLSGAPFIGVFFTKHFLLSEFMGVSNLGLSLVVLFCVFLSYFYSFRFCSILLNSKSSIVTGVLFTFSSGFIVYFWLFVNYYIFFTLDEVVLLNSVNSFNLMLFQLFSCFCAWFMYNSLYLSSWSSSLFGSDNVVELFYKLFFNILTVVSLALYRWDNYVISFMPSTGNSILNVYSIGLLNIVVLMVSIILMCYIII